MGKGFASKTARIAYMLLSIIILIGLIFIWAGSDLTTLILLLCAVLFVAIVSVIMYYLSRKRTRSGG